MFKGSFWYPDSPRQVALVVAIVAMIVLHQTEVVGLFDSTALLFGWIPAQIAYDMAFNLVGFLILVLMYVMAPKAPSRYESRGEQ